MSINIRRASTKFWLTAVALAGLGSGTWFITRAPAITFTVPTQSVAIVAATGSGAASSITATLPGVANKTTYIEGFDVTGAGATGASNVTVAVSGLTNTLDYTITAVAGATTANTALSIRFPSPVPASATNTAIVVTVPSLGTGNLNSTVSAYGFQQ